MTLHAFTVLTNARGRFYDIQLSISFRLTHHPHFSISSKISLSDLHAVSALHILDLTYVDQVLLNKADKLAMIFFHGMTRLSSLIPLALPSKPCFCRLINISVKSVLHILLSISGENVQAVR